jgi:hypothetical protein
MIEVCSDCGSKVSYRNVDVTTMADSSRQYMKVAHRCANAKCPNSDPRNHTMEWCKTVEG